MADSDREVGSSSTFLQRWRNITGSVYAKCVALADLIAGEDLTNNCLTIRQLTGWTALHFPAANNQATATKAAGAAGVKHVCTGFTVTAAAGTTAPTAIQLNVALRDGASGAGTIVWQSVIVIPATVGATTTISRQNLWIVGTAATAMTLEFSGAGGANTFLSVSMEGVDIS